MAQFPKLAQGAAALSLVGVLIGTSACSAPQADRTSNSIVFRDLHGLLEPLESLHDSPAGKMTPQVLLDHDINYFNEPHFWEQLTTDMARLGLNPETQLQIAQYVDHEVFGSGITDKQVYPRYEPLPELLEGLGHQSSIPASLEFIDGWMVQTQVRVGSRNGHVFNLRQLLLP